MEDASHNEPFIEVAQGLNSPEIKSNANIPFVDEFVELEHINNEPIRPQRLRDIEKGPEKRDGKVHASDLGAIHSPNSDTIVVDTPEGTLYITLDPESAKSSRTSPTSPSTLSSYLTDSVASPTTSKPVGAESKALIENEVDAEQRRANLRRNSISMPTLQNLEQEVFRQQYLQNPQDEVRFVNNIIIASILDGVQQNL